VVALIAIAVPEEMKPMATIREKRLVCALIGLKYHHCAFIYIFSCFIKLIRWRVLSIKVYIYRKPAKFPRKY